MGIVVGRRDFFAKERADGRLANVPQRLDNALPRIWFCVFLIKPKERGVTVFLIADPFQDEAAELAGQFDVIDSFRESGAMIFGELSEHGSPEIGKLPALACGLRKPSLLRFHEPVDGSLRGGVVQIVDDS